MPPIRFELPFLTREMLRFDKSARIALRVVSNSSVVETIIIHGCTRDGLFTLKHITVSNEVANSESFFLPDIPIWLSATITGTGTEYGAIFCTLSLEINGDRVATLTSGYINDIVTLDWPYASLKQSIPTNHGLDRTYTTSTVAVGTNISRSLGSGKLSRFKYGSVTLVTSATVASRNVHFRFSGTGGITLDFISPTAQTASTTRQYTFVPTSSASAYSDDDDIIIPVCNNIVDYDEVTFSTSCTNLQAGDQFTNMRICVEEWMYAGDF